jgi:hypothetical protein
MPRTAVALVAIALMCGLAIGIAFTQSPDWNKGTTDEKVKRLSDIAPGLGEIMIMYGNRFTNAYYAAKGGNWDLAGYMIDEMLEVQETGEMTRPSRAPLLKAFENNYLNKLQAAVKAKNFSQYSSLTPQVINACNQCHVKTEHAYVVYQLPSGPTAPLKMTKPK